MRGAGYFYGIELVKDKVTRETFNDDEAERLLRGFLSKALFDAGLYCRADDRGDPVVQLAPPLIIGPTGVRRDRADAAVGPDGGLVDPVTLAGIHRPHPGPARAGQGGDGRAPRCTRSSTPGWSRTSPSSTTGSRSSCRSPTPGAGDEVLFHGSTGSRLFRLLAAGQPTCLTVTLLDGLVLARSAFESSMNYRSAMVLGVAAPDRGRRRARRPAHHHGAPAPGSVGAKCRTPSAKERAATLTLALDLTESSVKIGTGGPDDDPADLASTPTLMRLWAGTVPLAETFGEPVPDDLCPPATPVPDYVRAWRRA